MREVRVIHPLYAVNLEVVRIAGSVPSEAEETEAPRRLPVPATKSFFSPDYVQSSAKWFLSARHSRESGNPGTFD